MSKLVTYRGAVYPWHCDHVGHGSVMWYSGKFDEAIWGLFAHIGVTPTFLREQVRGMAAVQQNITYKRGLLASDLVEITSRVLDVRERTIRCAHEMRNTETGEICATSEITAVHLDREARRACAFAPQIRAAADKLIEA